MYRPSETEIAYFAGFFDGEGTVSIQEPYTFPRPYLILANNHRGVLEDAQSILKAGKVYPPRQFRCYQLFIMKADEVIQVGNWFLPFLRVKALQVEWGIKLAQVVKSCPSRNIPKNLLELRLQIATIIKGENQKRGCLGEEACGVNTKRPDIL